MSVLREISLNHYVFGASGGLGSSIAIHADEHDHVWRFGYRCKPLVEDRREQQVNACDIERIRGSELGREALEVTPFAVTVCIGGIPRGESDTVTPAVAMEHITTHMLGLHNIFSVVRHISRSWMMSVPAHLTVICSTASFMPRKNETLYAGLTAAKAQMARAFWHELNATNPGSTMLVVHPGGMKSRVWEGTGVDTSKFMDPDAVAGIIVDCQMKQRRGELEPLHDLVIHRGTDGTPNVVHGPPTPRYA